MQYLNDFRVEFNIDTLEVDPRDWGVIYVHNIFNLLIKDGQVKYRSLAEWDRDIIAKTNFVLSIAEFIAQKKEESIQLFNS